MSKQDRNFDDIAEHFLTKIYGSQKGYIRLARLWTDFQNFLPELFSGDKLSVLDAGGGFGQLSFELAQLGHNAVLSDISKEMLNLAQRTHLSELSNSELLGEYQYVHSPIQALSDHLPGSSFDFVMCHAVLEWVIDPKDVLTHVIKFVKPGGYFSLTVYNKGAVYFRNLLKGNFRWVDRWMEQMDDPNADPALTMIKGRSLTPPGPLLPDTVETWLSELNCQVIKQTGIRVLDDYLNKHLTKGHSQEDILEKESYFGVRSPYCSMGRYVHFLGQKLY
ncbi:methyltransferase domain-containing protein [Litoribrevibacter albus]|uniref:tRNA 5-carboxymethoxyuridine methyltransferase n=1 Tax=Litoribrevibacter albus TaxID=1473156 RepID=A0AA37W4Y0_9GAMM|nr:methyltransferase domain-containing protein [Litoribrevibacter albus]GLQ30612.1 tRNA 5-carboxymethoxyuridine methyltransferase [Litoribrevibacter albus]